MPYVKEYLNDGGDFVAKGGNYPAGLETYCSYTTCGLVSIAHKLATNELYLEPVNSRRLPKILDNDKEYTAFKFKKF
jgi:hypothetical protein